MPYFTTFRISLWNSIINFSLVWPYSTSLYIVLEGHSFLLGSCLCCCWLDIWSRLVSHVLDTRAFVSWLGPRMSRRCSPTHTEDFDHSWQPSSIIWEGHVRWSSIFPPFFLLSFAIISDDHNRWADTTRSSHQSLPRVQSGGELPWLLRHLTSNLWLSASHFTLVSQSGVCCEILTHVELDHWYFAFGGVLYW